MFSRLYDAFRHHVDAVNYALGGGGLLAAMKGFLDANTAQLWIGAIVAAGSVLWGFLRDQRSRDHDARHKEELRQLAVQSHKDVIAWQKWAMEYRRKKLEETGVDPFKDGTPSFQPFDVETKEAASD